MGLFAVFFLGSEKEEMISLIAKRMQLPRELVEAEFDKFIEELKKFQKED